MTTTKGGGFQSKGNPSFRVPKESLCDVTRNPVLSLWSGFPAYPPTAGKLASGSSIVLSGLRSTGMTGIANCT